MPFAHVDRHHHDDGRQRGERYVGGERRGDQHNAEQHQRVDDAGNRRAAAGFDVGRGAGDGAGGGKAAEERGGDIGQALGDQFLVGVVAVIDLAVGDACREQRLDGAEQGDGDGRRDQLAEIVNRQAGRPKLGSSCGMPLKRLPMVSTGS
jgi:hypothetical protein